MVLRKAWTVLWVATWVLGSVVAPRSAAWAEDPPVAATSAEEAAQEKAQEAAQEAKRSADRWEAGAALSAVTTALFTVGAGFAWTTPLFPFAVGAAVVSGLVAGGSLYRATSIRAEGQVAVAPGTGEQGTAQTSDRPVKGDVPADAATAGAAPPEGPRGPDTGQGLGN